MFKDKNFIINGKEELILAGEIHYFRLDPKDWQDRIDKLKEMGLNAVATYIPWICHEEEENKFDFEGKTNERLNLIKFLELCNKNDLYFIARPGPFIMAEMKNEGIPYWIAEKYPEICPITWDNKKAPNPTLDYLNENFLSCCRKWYKNIMDILKNYIYPNGNIIAIQLDNEIGMLSWVANAPDLTDVVLKDFKEFITDKYCNKEAIERYKFNLEDFNLLKQQLRSPKDDISLQYHKDLGEYMRFRTYKYIKTLANYIKENDINNIPLLINIHGTGGGRSLTYPIGVSQLYKSYSGIDGFMAGSDLYLGDLNMNNFQDLYVANAITDCVNDNNQPLSVLEFDAGDSNYGQTYSSRVSFNSTDFKTKMCLAQGNRLINYYLFCGGYNYKFDKNYNDGNNRIAITGEKHGFAAPIDAEGELNYTYSFTKEGLNTINALKDKIAYMKEENENIALAFIPDYYMTEYHYHECNSEIEFVRELERFRTGNNFETIIKGMLLNSYNFKAFNIQDNNLLNTNIKTLVLFSTSYMDKNIQENICNFIKNGGNVLLYGKFPIKDMEGKECTILKDLLNIKNIINIESSQHFYTSVYPTNYFEEKTEVRCSYAQLFDLDNKLDLMKEASTNKVCAFEKDIQKGKIIVFSTDYICHLKNIDKILKSLNANKNIEILENRFTGIFSTSTKGKNDETIIYLLNLDDFSKEFYIKYKEKDIFYNKKLSLTGKKSLMLPINITINNLKIECSTAEIYKFTNDTITFKLSQPEDFIVIYGENIIKEDDTYKIEEKEGKTYIISLLDGRINDYLTLKIK